MTAHAALIWNANGKSVITTEGIAALEIIGLTRTRMRVVGKDSGGGGEDTVLR